MWDLPGPGLEPVSPALAGGFLTTVPQGKPLLLCSRNELDPQKDTIHLLQQLASKGQKLPKDKLQFADLL